MVGHLDPLFSTKEVAESWSPVTAPDWVRIAFLDRRQIPGSGGIYRKCTERPNHDAVLRILVNGVSNFFELAEASPFAEMFGAVPNDPSAGPVNDKAFADAVVYAASRGCEIRVGPGRFSFSAGFETPSTGSYYRMDTNWGLVGSGPGTVLSREQAGVAADYSSDDHLRAGACIRHHSSNTTIKNMRFEDCAVAIYRGQRPSDKINTSVAFNVISDLWVHNCGTGIIDASAGGNHYNRHVGLHIWQCQIGYHSRPGDPPKPAAGSNSNRNSFNGRVARCWVGYLLEHSGGCTLEGYSEGNRRASDGPRNNAYPFPTGVLYGQRDLDILLQEKACAVYIDEASSHNQLMGFFDEGSDWTLFNKGRGTKIVAGHLDQDASPSRCIFIRAPALMI